MASIPRDIKLYRGAADPGQEGEGREGGIDGEPRAGRGKGNREAEKRERVARILHQTRKDSAMPVPVQASDMWLF